MKTRYLVFYNEYYGSAFLDSGAAVFKNKDQAKQYCKELNKKLPKDIKKLGDRYCFMKIEYIK